MTHQFGVSPIMGKPIDRPMFGRTRHLNHVGRTLEGIARFGGIYQQNGRTHHLTQSGGLHHPTQSGGTYHPTQFGRTLGGMAQTRVQMLEIFS